MKKLDNDKIVIKCPECGYEYLPAEIYIPNSFLGRPFGIEREYISGEIQDYFGSTMDLNEKYICDKCGKPFKVKAKIQFFTSSYDINKEYYTSIKKEQLFLDEE